MVVAVALCAPQVAPAQDTKQATSTTVGSPVAVSKPVTHTKKHRRKKARRHKEVIHSSENDKELEAIKAAKDKEKKQH